MIGQEPIILMKKMSLLENRKTLFKRRGERQGWLSTKTNSQFMRRSQSLPWPVGKHFRLATPGAVHTVCSAKAAQTSGWAAVNISQIGGPLVSIVNQPEGRRAAPEKEIVIEKLTEEFNAEFAENAE